MQEGDIGQCRLRARAPFLQVRAWPHPLRSLSRCGVRVASVGCGRASPQFVGQCFESVQAEIFHFANSRNLLQTPARRNCLSWSPMTSYKKKGGREIPPRRFSIVARLPHTPENSICHFTENCLLVEIEEVGGRGGGIMWWCLVAQYNVILRVYCWFLCLVFSKCCSVYDLATIFSLLFFLMPHAFVIAESACSTP